MKELTRAEELILLTIVRLQERAYGVAIRQQVKETTGKAMAYGTLYFILDQLTAKEFVYRTKADPTPERGGRSKTYFQLTPDGLEALKASLEFHRKAWNGLEDAVIGKELIE